MKLIIAIVRPERFDAIRAALAEQDVYLLTVTDVHGCGRERAGREWYRGTTLADRTVPKLKLEIAVTDAFVEAAVEAILGAARTVPTGDIGDGKVFILPLEDCIRIRSGERGPAAIGP